MQAEQQSERERFDALESRYRFLLGFLIDKGVLTNKRYDNGTWVLRGIYGIDDSGLKGAGRTAEEAVDNAITANQLDSASAEKFWQATHAALSHPSTPQGWQDIESAPKTGRTLLLGCFNSAGKWRTMRGQWMSQNYIDEYWEEPDDVEPGWFETVVESDDLPNCWPIEPTHYMPLPAPPEQGSKHADKA